MQALNNLLRQQEHGHVDNYLHASRAEHHVRQRITFAWKVKFPDGSVWATLRIAAPPKSVPGSVDGNKHSAPVQQNSRLDQGEDRGVAASVDENQLTDKFD